MPLGRREFCIAGVGLPLLSVGSLVLAERTLRGPPSAPYRSSLVNGLTPKRIEWDDHVWSADMGSTWNRGMEHCFRYTETNARFELQPTTADHAQNDPDRKRRSELHCTKTLLPNAVPIWGAMSFVHHRWSDPAGMAQGWGGVHGQIHMHKFGGSPALAFRRHGDGSFMVTTRGEFEPDTTTRWRGAVSFDQPHDLVYRIVIEPNDGELDVWLDGQHVVNLRKASLGSHLGGCYWCIGCYYGGGITCPVVAEYANHAFPGTGDLSKRIAARPQWTPA